MGFLIGEGDLSAPVVASLARRFPQISYSFVIHRLDLSAEI
jgi:hypothetical protein